MLQHVFWHYRLEIGLGEVFGEYLVPAGKEADMDNVVIINILYFYAFRIVKCPVHLIRRGVYLHVAVVFFFGIRHNRVAFYSLSLVQGYGAVPYEE